MGKTSLLFTFFGFGFLSIMEKKYRTFLLEAFVWKNIFILFIAKKSIINWIMHLRRMGNVQITL